MMKSDRARVDRGNLLRESARATSGRLRRRVRRQQLAPAVAPPQHVPADVIPATQQIAHPFLGFIRYVNRRQLPRAEQAQELGRIAPIGLDALPRAAWRQPWRHDLARPLSAVIWGYSS
jgi:hypothetical protein